QVLSPLVENLIICVLIKIESFSQQLVNVIEQFVGCLPHCLGVLLGLCVPFSVCRLLISRTAGFPGFSLAVIPFRHHYYPSPWRNLTAGVAAGSPAARQVPVKDRLDPGPSVQ